MANISVTAADVKPLEGAQVRRGTAGSAGAVGSLVYLASDGKWDKATNAASASAEARGIVVAVNGVAGASSFAENDRIDIVREGAVAFGTGMTPGGKVYVGTDGKGDQVLPSGAGTHVFIVGYAEAANIIYLSPQVAAPTAN